MSSRKTAPLLLLLSCMACAAGAAAESVRSDAPTAHDAMDDDAAPACGSQPSYGEPLVVDLPSKQRMDLELAMRSGVPVVRYDCGKLELIQDCRLEGGFEYAGVSLKEDVVVLRNRDEVRANLPISGANIAASLERGTSLQLALAMIGKQSTTVHAASTADLEGRCDGATHFVRAAVVGAFALQRGSDASVSAAAEIFKAGMGAASNADRDVTMRDGKVDECRAASPDATSPPRQCASSIRLELVALAGPDAPASDTSHPWVDPCPEGYRLTAGKCTQSPAEAYVCAPSDKAECQAQCDAGNAESCYHAAMPDLTTAPADRLPIPKVVALLERACDGGSAQGCTGLATFYELGVDGTVTRDITKAKALFERACNGGDVEACTQLAGRLSHRSVGADKTWPADEVAATKLYQRACDLGAEGGCFTVASRYFEGLGTARNIARGKSVLRRGCDGGNAERCTELAMLMLGLMDGGKEFAGIQDIPAGLALLERGCTRSNHESSCLLLAQLYATGTKVAVDKPRAKTYHDRVCPSAREPGACERLGKLLK